VCIKCDIKLQAGDYVEVALGGTWGLWTSVEESQLAWSLFARRSENWRLHDVIR